MYLDRYHEIYNPIADRETRLIYLQPGTGNEPLLGRLEVISIDNAPSYTALSYVWGSSEPVDSVTVNGASIPIAHGLRTALRNVRQEREELALWADALCICQGDNLEKAKQVQMMGEIFRRAATTCIWLGEESPNDAEVVSYLCAADSASSGHTLHDLHASALQAFFGRTWFRRLWILQEALLSQKPIVYCGQKRLPFSRVVKLSQDLIFHNLGNQYGSIFKNCPLKRCMHEWDRLQKAIANRGGWPLIYALPMTDKLECTKFEDRVYALLGLATPADRAAIQPDYSKSVSDIQQELSAYLVGFQGNPFEALHYSNSNNNVKLSSWARDWTISSGPAWKLAYSRESHDRWHIMPEEPDRQVDVRGLNVANLQWRMDSLTRFNTDFVRFSDDLRILSVKGLTHDVVSAVFPAPEEPAALRLTSESWRDITTEKAKAYGSIEARLDMFGKLLCRGGYSDSGGNHFANCYDAYDSWVNARAMRPTSDNSMPELDVGKTDFAHRVKRLCEGRSFIMSEKGFIGLAPASVKPGDLLCCFLGNRDIFILRPLSEGRMKFIGASLTMGLGDKAEVGGRSDNLLEYWIE